jgi:ABC-type antimicrobial peptide transport system permease subunit
MISSLLFGIEAYDVVAFGSAGVAVLLVGFVATLIPALRATRIDPVHIIREE